MLQLRDGGIMKKFGSVVVVLLLTLTACGSPSYADWLDEYRQQEIAWGTCDEELFEDPEYLDTNFKTTDVKCATVKVPISYDESLNSEDITIQLMLDPAKEDQRQGALFSNPGGPGQSGISYIQSVAYPKSVRDAFDIIGFDPRGVGASTPVKCDDDLDLRSYFEYYFDHKNQSQVDEDRKASDEYYEDCMENNPHWWGMTTDNTVRDIDIMRHVISGDDPLNFIGHSYGTTLAARYIALFPEHVGRMILDSPVTANTESIQEEIESAKSLAEARNRLFDKCAQDPKCPGSSRAQIENNLINARDLMLEGKMQGYIATQVENGFFERGNGTSPYLIIRAIVYLTYFPLDDAYPTFKMIYRDLVLKNDPWGFESAGLIMDGYDMTDLSRDNSYDILNLVNCLDRDERDTRTQSEIEKEDKQISKIDKFENRFLDVYDFEPTPEPKPGCFWTWRAYEDENIPDPPASEPALENTSGNRVFIVGSKGDNVTPYTWSKQVAASLKSDLITYEGTGHAVLFGDIKCLDDLAETYLLTGKLPDGPVSCSK